MTPTPRYAQIIVDIAHSHVDRVFTYRVPDGMRPEPGTRVSVPFGRGTQEGYVLALTDESDLAPERIKPIKALLEDYPAILPPLVELARELSQSARCPLAETLRLMIPPQMRGGRVQVKTETMAQLAVTGDAVAEAREQQARAPKRKLLIDLLSDGEPHPVSDLKLLARSPLDALRALEKQGVVRLFEREVLRSPYPDPPLKEKDPTLTDAQEEALSEVLPALKQRRGAFLLHGVTGSGKTEVYIRAVRACLQMGLGAIVLVPEIVLTPQMVRWFRGRFEDDAAVLHSRLSAGERFDEWRRIRMGHARVVIGARSAVFAPVENLGLIIVDEEHEGSYVSDRVPAYDARAVAASRAGREGAVTVLASATPSILSFAKARRGDYTMLEMPGRVNGRPLPEVTVVDMREELRLGNTGIFSGILLDKLDTCIHRGQQAMLFINRRGYASSVLCRSCGHTMGCAQCDVTLTYHQWDQGLHCHYCGQVQPMPAACPACGSRYIRTLGVGTQRVEEEVLRRYPAAEVVRMDLDTTGLKDAHRELINRFRSGKAQIMVGTQMIAKGLDFPQVTLVGAVLADLSLNLPDFRSAERSFQLLTQVAGRAGRGRDPGEVVIQTYQPDNYALQAAARQDYRGFFEQEFARRRRDLYPPFTMLVRLLCLADSEQAARQTSAGLYQQLAGWLSQHPALKKRVLYYREDAAPIKRLMGRDRAQVLLKLLVHPESERIIAALTELAKQAGPGEAVLEVDPATLA